MKKRSKIRFVKPVKKETICQQSNQLGRFAAELNQLPDAGAVRKSRLRAVPVGQLPLIF